MKHSTNLKANPETVDASDKQKKLRKFTSQDIPSLMEKIFSEFDTDHNNRFTKDEFPKVIRSLIELIGGDCPSVDDIQDIFNLLDQNGDETVDRSEFTAIMKVFFKVLQEKEIDVFVSHQSDLIV